MQCTMLVFPDETSSSSSVLQLDTDGVLTDLLPCPRAICTIPKDNKAAAKVTKLQPTAIQRTPNRWPCHLNSGGEIVFRHGEGGRDDSKRRGESQGEGCIKTGGWVRRRGSSAHRYETLR